MAQASVRSADLDFNRPEDERLKAAVLADDADAVGAALRSGADPNAVGRHRVTPLMIAVDHQKSSAVNALLGAGADPNAVAADGQTPVVLAVQSYRSQPHGRRILMAILENGGNPDARRPDGDPVILRFVLDHTAAGLGLMKTLGADLNALDRGGDPLITSIAMAQDWDMVWAFIELGAEVDYENGKSRQPLSLALKGNYPAPDSPLYPYKAKVWHYLHDKGIALHPLK